MTDYSNTTIGPALGTYTVTLANGTSQVLSGVALYRVEGANVVFYDTADASDTALATFALTGSARVTAIAATVPDPGDPEDVVNAAQALIPGRQDSASAELVAATTLTVKGRNFLDYLGDRPRGLVSQGVESTLSLQGVVAEKGIAEIAFTAYPGRGYRVTIDGPEYGISDTSTYVNFKARCTVDGSAPTVASTLVRDFDGESPQSVVGRLFKGSFLWYPPSITNANGQTVRLLLSFARAAGSGTVGVAPVNNRLQMWVEDIGPSLPNSIVVNGTQTSSPPPPPAAAPQSITDTFYSTWTASFRANGSRWSVGDRLYQGYDSYNGNEASMVGFDVTSIRSRLAGATLRSAKLYILNWHTWQNGAGYLLVGSHGSDTIPAAYGGPNLVPRRATLPITEGAWAEVDVTGLFSEIVGGTTSGVLLGPAPSNDLAYYGYYYGQNYTNRPRIVATWEK